MTSSYAAFQFFHEDVVRDRQTSAVGLVSRCWNDPEEFPPHENPVDPLLRRLRRGEIGVSFYIGAHETRAICHQCDFELLDRNFQVGDYVKRSVNEIDSGVVTQIEIQTRLQHVITGHTLERLVPGDQLESVADLAIADFVTYSDWIGQVEEMFDEAWVQVSQGSEKLVVRLPELSARLAVGDKGSDLLPFPEPDDTSNEFPRSSDEDTILDVKHTVLAISWLALNQSLDPTIASTLERPKTIWKGPELSQLTVIQPRFIPRVGDKVLLKSSSSIVAPVSSHPVNGLATDTIEVKAMLVIETARKVTVMWQNGEQEEMSALDLIPYVNVDEHDCWPGDYVLWKGDGSQKPGIVQSVQASDRTALVKWFESDGAGQNEVVSLLELDVHGAGDWDAHVPSTEGFGVHRGDFVFIHPAGTTNGVIPPRVPRIGELESFVREPQEYDDHGRMLGWRGEVAATGSLIAHLRGSSIALPGGLIQFPQRAQTGIDWFGEVTHLRIDGSVKVKLPNDTYITVPLERLTRIYEEEETLEGLWGDGFEDHQLHHHYHYKSSPTVVQVQYEDGSWHPYDEHGQGEDEWVDADSDDFVTQETRQDVVPASIVDELQMVDPATINLLRSSIDDLVEASPPVPEATASSPMKPVIGLAYLPDSPWHQFSLLSSAPEDHAFITTPASQPSRTFMTRLAKEYRALESSLPDTILVRGYEDRTDLLRCMIIGPENTPYQDAPFVIDWLLESNFPQTPPRAHFHSWTNGNGRVNPNLYEEGKVCLSILGTWSGDRTESWDPARSSLLQALVSIQGLVLVREPWFCEPAYSSLRGTKEGIVNSRLYSERAFVLARGFVRRALENPPIGLQTEIEWLYYDQSRLTKVISHCKLLIEKGVSSSEDDHLKGHDSEAGITTISTGGAITLKRTLLRLEGLASLERD